MTKDEALRLALEALEKLWNIIDDIDTYSDMAKADEKLYRSLVERRQRQRFEETGISTDGYELHGGAITAIKAALEAKDEPNKYAMDIECTKCGAKQSGVLTVHTTPPQRKPLTEKELNVLGTQWHFNLLETKDKTELFAFARAIEAAHGIKGEA